MAVSFIYKSKREVYLKTFFAKTHIRVNLVCFVLFSFFCKFVCVFCFVLLIYCIKYKRRYN